MVISQVYGGGGFASDGYKKDFIELHNRGTTAVSLEGWSIQQASATGTSWIPTALSGSVAPGGYFLIAGQGGSLGKVLPPPDVKDANFNMSVKGAKIALVQGKTNGLSGGCPTGDAHVVDFVGFGNANCKLGDAVAPAHSNTTSTLRNWGGCDDTSENGVNFMDDTPNPRNTESAALDCTCE